MDSYRVTLISKSSQNEQREVLKQVIAAVGVSIEWDEHDCSDGLLDSELLASCKKNGLILKASASSPPKEGVPLTVELRKQLNLWATVRADRAFPGSRFPNLDIVVIRETSEDIYSGFEHEVMEGVYEAVRLTTLAACERIARYAFDYARAHGRKKLTIVHKANIMKKSDGMFLRLAKKIGDEYEDVVVEDVIVDALCMRLVKYPEYYDVLLTGNLFGDIVSDLCSGLAGGGPAQVSASYNPEEKLSLFESLCDDDDRYAQVALLNAARLMLEFLGEEEAATRMEKMILLMVHRITFQKIR